MTTWKQINDARDEANRLAREYFQQRHGLTHEQANQLWVEISAKLEVAWRLAIQTGKPELAAAELERMLKEMKP